MRFIPCLLPILLLATGITSANSLYITVPVEGWTLKLASHWPYPPGSEKKAEALLRPLMVVR